MIPWPPTPHFIDRVVACSAPTGQQQLTSPASSPYFFCATWWCNECKNRKRVWVVGGWAEGCLYRLAIKIKDPERFIKCTLHFQLMERPLVFHYHHHHHHHDRLLTCCKLLCACPHCVLPTRTKGKRRKRTGRQKAKRIISGSGEPPSDSLAECS